MNLKFPNFSIIFLDLFTFFLMMFGRYEIKDFVKNPIIPNQLAHSLTPESKLLTIILYFIFEF